MPFSPDTKNTGDLITATDWNDAMQAVVELFGKFHASSGHQHTGTGEDAPPIDTASLANGAVTGDKIANNSISGSKIQAGTITASNLSSGILSSNIGVAVMAGLTHGQSIPVPSGFSRSDCIFYAAIKYINIDLSLSPHYHCSVDNNGKINIDPDGNVIAMGLAIAKRGGW